MDKETFLNLKNIGSLIYIIPSYILYLLILWIMFLSPAKNNFSGSFYKLFGCSAINYLIQSIFYYFTLRFSYTPVFFPLVKDCAKSSWIYPIMYIFMFYSAAALHLYSVALSFNRFTVFIFKAGYAKFWKRWLKYILGFCILFPVCFAWHFHLIRFVN